MSANMDKLIDDIVRQVIGERAPKKTLSNMNLETAKYIIDKVEKRLRRWEFVQWLQLPRRAVILLP